MKKRVVVVSTAIFGGLLMLTGCKSYWIDTTVKNETGQQIREMEVDYPTASFGINSVAPGASMHYRLQVRGSGPMRVEYLTSDGKTVHLQGTTLSERQQGQITIRLLPAGKAEFLPSIKPVPGQTAP